MLVLAIFAGSSLHCIAHEASPSVTVSVGLDCVQVPLGTVVHRVLPQAAETAEEGFDLAKGPPRLQMHWIGARDYVSSDEEGSASGGCCQINPIRGTWHLLGEPGSSHIDCTTPSDGKGDSPSAKLPS